MYYGITTWVNTAAKYTNEIQVLQNYIVKSISKASCRKTKLSSWYSQPNLLKPQNIFKLEVLKVVYKFLKTLPKFFINYFLFTFHTHKYPISFANNKNWSSILFKYNKSFTQKSIKLEEYKLWKNIS